MEAIKKAKLQEYINEFQVKQVIEADIRKVIEEFKHYKQVNKRFTDRLEKLGYHAYILKDYSHKLRVSKHTGPYQNVSIEIYVYGEELTWSKILTELDRCQHKQQEDKYTARLAAHDTEIAELENILAYLKQKEKLITGFSFYQLTHKLEDAIRYSKE